MSLSLHGQSLLVQKDALSANTGCTRMKAATIWRADADINSATFVVANTKIAIALEPPLHATRKLRESLNKIDKLLPLGPLNKNEIDEFMMKIEEFPQLRLLYKNLTASVGNSLENNICTLKGLQKEHKLEHLPKQTHSHNLQEQPNKRGKRKK